MEINDIIKLMQAVSDYSLTRFELEEGDVKLSIKKDAASKVVYEMPATAIPQAAAVPALAAGTGSTDINSDKVVASPLVGTFYDCSGPGAEPFVKVGDSVKKGQVMGIIEAMKLMNEIECEYDGVVEAILVGNEDVVEYGQPLFRIR